MNRVAKFVIALMAVESSTVSIAFACVGNWRMMAYWFGIALVNTIAYTF